MSLDTIAPPLDIAALVYFALAVFIYRVIVARRAETRGGLLGAIQEHRVSWMLNMAKREQRMLMPFCWAVSAKGTRSLPPPVPSRSALSLRPWVRGKSCRQCSHICPS